MSESAFPLPTFLRSGNQGFSFDALSQLDARVTALEDAGGSLSAAGRWTLVEPQANMGKSKVKFSSDPITESSTVIFSIFGKSGVDLTNVLLACTKMYMQEETDADNWAVFTVDDTSLGDEVVEMNITVLSSRGSQNAVYGRVINAVLAI